MDNNTIMKEYVLRPLYEQLMMENIVEVRGHKTVELLGASVVFNGDEDGLINIGPFKTSYNYVNAEIDWYESMDPHINKISPHASMWGDVADDRGMANSNYGYLIFSPQNGYQYDNVLKELKADPHSRRAVMYYTNPFIHYTGGKDHICTTNVGYTIRDGKLHAFVNMRSSDARFGIIGADLAWQTYVLNKLAKDLVVAPGNIHWYANSLHIYERHFKQLKEIFNDA